MDTFGEAYMGPLVQMQQIEASRAQQQYQQAQTADLLQKSAQERQMMQLMGSMGGDQGLATGGQQKPTAIPDMLETLAQRAMGAGLYDHAGKIAKQAADIRMAGANTLQNQTLTQKQLAEGALKTIELAQQMFSRVRSQEDLERANANWTGLTGTVSPLAGETWSPQLMQEYADEILAFSGKLTSKDREADRALREGELQSRQEFRELIGGIKRDTLEQRKREAEAKGKVGGGVIGTPAPVEINQASILIEKMYPSFKDDKQLLKQAAFDIASEAKALRKENPALAAGEALSRAFEKAKAAGDFQETEKYLGMMKEPQYKPPKPAAAAPAPEARVVGKTTITKDGVTYVWTESGGQKGWAPAKGK